MNEQQLEPQDVVELSEWRKLADDYRAILRDWLHGRQWNDMLLYREMCFNYHKHVTTVAELTSEDELERQAAEELDDEIAALANVMMHAVQIASRGEGRYGGGDDCGVTRRFEMAVALSELGRDLRELKELGIIDSQTVFSL